MRKMTIDELLEKNLIQAIDALYGQSIDSTQIQLQPTRKEFVGDITIVVFPFLRISRKKPEDTAQDLGQWLVEHTPELASFNVIKGFLNLVVTPDYWLQALKNAFSEPQYGIKPVDEKAPVVMVEYSSPNTNKPLHLGHVRNNLLGFSLCKILEANGNKVIKTNIVNDRGIHICKSMLAWKKWGNGETPASSGKKGDHLVGDYYVAFDKQYKLELAGLQANGMTKEESEAASTLMAEAREMLLGWEAGDLAIRELWETMNTWVYAGFDETY